MGAFEGLAVCWLADFGGLSGRYTRGTFAIAGIFSGLLPSFLLSTVYLRFMRNRSWQSGLGWGSLFGAFAGGVSGLLMGITFASAEDRADILAGTAIPGVVVGAIVGVLISALFGWYFLAKVKS